MKSILIKLVSSLIILYVMGYGVSVLRNIWTNDIDIKKTFPNPFSFIHFKKIYFPPIPFYELSYKKEKYKEGLIVHDVSWKKDFLLYEFTFANKSKYSEMEDIRLKFEIPGVVIKHNIKRMEGMQNVVIASDNDYFRKVDPITETIVETMKYNTNVFTINIVKAYPLSYVDVYLVFQKLISEEGMPSYFTAEYNSVNEGGNVEVKSKTHPIIVEKDKNDWRINTEKEVTGNPIHAYGVFFKEPLK